MRLLGALELLTAETKIELGRMLLDLWPKKEAGIDPAGHRLVHRRLAAREPAYGPLNTVVPPDDAAAWIEELLDSPDSDATVPLRRR